MLNLVSNNVWVEIPNEEFRILHKDYKNNIHGILAFHDEHITMALIDSEDNVIHSEVSCDEDYLKLKCDEVLNGLVIEVV